jgi:hypothetical protein
MRVSVTLDFCLILAWGSEEAGRYLETFKAYESKPVDWIAEKPGTTNLEIVLKIHGHFGAKVLV